MSVSAPLKRFAPRCLYCTPSPLAHHPQRRPASFSSRKQGEPSSDSPSSNPILDEYRRSASASAKASDQPTAAPRAGDIASSSIFEDDRRATTAQAANAAQIADTAASTPKRNPANTLRVLDPDPNARERWERKKVIQAIRKGGRLTRAELVQRTERQHHAKSEMMKTSIKKLGMLARQIAGKTLADAITQMRFSRKKAAASVLAHLEAARDEAVVMRGMGLGAAATPPSPAAVPSAKTPLEIELKDGKRHAVSDASEIYIDQAWVGRGSYGKLPDYRARGRVFIMRTPWTSLSIVLKEEATRVRQWREREEKRQKDRVARVWVPLPDRPVQGARGQWYPW